MRPRPTARSFYSRNLEMDTCRREVSRDGVPVPLKPKEFELLSFFARNPEQAFTREQLLKQIWGFDFAGDSRTVDVHVRWFREKIEKEPAQPTRFITLRGVGYRSKAESCRAQPRC